MSFIDPPLGVHLTKWLIDQPEATRTLEVARNKAAALVAANEVLPLLAETEPAAAAVAAARGRASSTSPRRPAAVSNRPAASYQRPAAAPHTSRAGTTHQQPLPNQSNSNSTHCPLCNVAHGPICYSQYPDQAPAWFTHNIQNVDAFEAFKRFHLESKCKRPLASFGPMPTSRNSTSNTQRQDDTKPSRDNSSVPRMAGATFIYPTGLRVSTWTTGDAYPVSAVPNGVPASSYITTRSQAKQSASAPSSPVKSSSPKVDNRPRTPPSPRPVPIPIPVSPSKSKAPTAPRQQSVSPSRRSHRRPHPAPTPTPEQIPASAPPIAFRPIPIPRDAILPKLPLTPKQPHVPLKQTPAESLQVSLTVQFLLDVGVGVFEALVGKSHTIRTNNPSSLAADDLLVVTWAELEAAMAQAGARPVHSTYPFPPAQPPAPSSPVPSRDPRLHTPLNPAAPPFQAAPHSPTPPPHIHFFFFNLFFNFFGGRCCRITTTRRGRASSTAAATTTKRR